MPVLGVVVTLSERPAAREAALAAMRADPRLTVGEAMGPAGSAGRRVPVVIDTIDRDEDRACWRALEALPGVDAIELAFADFSDLHPIAAADAAADHEV